MQAAVRAVDEADVLEDDLDYVALGKQLTQRKQQGAAANGASARPRAAESPASPAPGAEPAEVPEDRAYWAAVQSAMSSDKESADPETRDLAGAKFSPIYSHPTAGSICVFESLHRLLDPFLKLKTGRVHGPAY